MANASDDTILVRVVSVDTSRVIRGAKPGDFAEVIFQIGPAELECRIPISLSRMHFDDVDIIPIARHYLCRLVRDLSVQLSAWEMTLEEVARRQLPDKSSPSKGPAQPHA